MEQLLQTFLAHTGDPLDRFFKAKTTFGVDADITLLAAIIAALSKLGHGRVFVFFFSSFLVF
jgi:hypothetical protein